MRSLIVVFALFGLSLMSVAHQHYCDHKHNINGTITWDCGDLRNTNHAPTGFEHTEQCSIKAPPAESNRLYCSFPQEYCEFFSNAVKIKEKEDADFCKSGGLTPERVSTSAISITHPHGDEYCHQSWSFRCHEEF